MSGDGQITGVSSYKKYDINDVVETWMVEANCAAARSQGTIGTIVRKHTGFNKEKLRKFSESLNANGIAFDSSYKKKIAESLNLLPAELRSDIYKALVFTIKGAKYTEWEIDAIPIETLDEEDDINYIGHSGLHRVVYTHFTSPIRRYVDIEVHRAISDKFKSDIAEYKTKVLISVESNNDALKLEIVRKEELMNDIHVKLQELKHLYKNMLDSHTEKIRILDVKRRETSIHMTQKNSLEQQANIHNSDIDRGKLIYTFESHIQHALRYNKRHLNKIRQDYAIELQKFDIFRHQRLTELKTYFDRQHFEMVTEINELMRQETDSYHMFKSLNESEQIETHQKHEEYKYMVSRLQAVFEANEAGIEHEKIGIKEAKSLINPTDPSKLVYINNTMFKVGNASRLSKLKYFEKFIKLQKEPTKSLCMVTHISEVENKVCLKIVLIDYPSISTNIYVDKLDPSFHEIKTISYDWKTYKGLIIWKNGEETNLNILSKLNILIGYCKTTSPILFMSIMGSDKK
jgi:hypothetical protein